MFQNSSVRRMASFICRTHSPTANEIILPSVDQIFLPKCSCFLIEKHYSLSKTVLQGQSPYEIDFPHNFLGRWVAQTLGKEIPKVQRLTLIPYLVLCLPCKKQSCHSRKAKRHSGKLLHCVLKTMVYGGSQTPTSSNRK